MKGRPCKEAGRIRLEKGEVTISGLYRARFIKALAPHCSVFQKLLQADRPQVQTEPGDRRERAAYNVVL
jgi:hypothetical protein